MRLGIIILTFSVALAGDGQGPAPSGNKPIKCGWGFHPPDRLPRIAALLARPTRDTFFISPTNAFAVHYDTASVHSPNLTDSDEDGTPDWVEAVAAALDSSRNLLLALGFDPAPDDEDGVYDVYLQEYNGGTYGFTNPDGYSQGRLTSYIIIDNDFAQEENYYTHDLGAAQITCAHEYFHAVQMGYKPAYSDLFFYELSSNWFEEIAFPEVNDWVYWYPDFGNNPTMPITTPPLQGGGYSIAIFGHYLTWWSGGIDIMRQWWDAFKPVSVSAVDALENGLAANNRNLTSAWTDFVARLFFNGLAPAYYFYSDQDSLDAPSLGPVEVLSGDVQKTFTFLRPGKVDIQTFELAQPANLRLEIETAPPKHAGRIILDAPGWSLHNLTTQPWYASGLSSLARLVVVVGSSGENVTVSVAATDTLTGLVFELNAVGPNPMHPRWPYHRQLAIGYTVARAMTEGEHRVEIYNLLGQEVYRWQDRLTVGEGSHTLRLPTQAMASWPSGMYLLRFTLDRRHTFTRKFTILR